ncbi:hypothetical protein Dsin_005205 [Dipteronia sinensis]|uniref:PB1-like domain-containing protein n=1 Tax=Dipteronia sinensis TaxID=43782 RepID=A0AAE0AW73_9ROSI|nr:hypothetical protein Dsin_005205 [Dipteronia sinensis]
MVEEQYRKIKDNAETYPYVWGSYIVVYGGLPSGLPTDGENFTKPRTEIWSCGVAALVSLLKLKQKWLEKGKTQMKCQNMVLMTLTYSLALTYFFHSGGHFDVTMDNYNGGRINYFDYINIDELSMLDLDEIAMKLKYKLPVGYWIQLSRYGMPYQIMRDEELLWFGDKIPENRVIDLYLECIQPLQAFKGDELIPSQQPESYDLMYDTSDDEDNRASAAASEIEVNRASAAAADTEDGPTGFGNGLAGFGDGPPALGDGSASFGDGTAGFNEQGEEELIVEDAERAKSKRKNNGVAEEAEADKGDERLIMIKTQKL